MKINEITNIEFRKNEIEYNLEVLNQKTIHFIKENCSDFLSETSNLLFRGINNQPYIFNGITPENRKPKDSGISWQNAIDQKLKESGFIALRSNSIFCTGSIATAQDYGTAYAIFPINGFTYTWSPDSKDFYIDYNLEEYDWAKQKDIKNESDLKFYSQRLRYQLFKDLHELTPIDFSNKYNFINTNLNDAIDSGHEIYIHGKYVAVEYYDLLSKNNKLM